jgi:DNA-binding GntR family transcriptional regulator
MNQIQKSRLLHLQTYEILKNEILSGKLKSGERLSESRISQELGVSRSPVREALRMLEQDHLVVLTSSGLIINIMKMSDMEEVYQCRIALEPYAANLAANNLDNKDIINLKSFINKAKESHQKKEYDSLVEFNTGFHDLIVGKCGNSRLIGILERLRALTILKRRAELEFYDQRNNEYLVEHEQILKSLAEKDGEAAEFLMKKHIENDYNIFKKSYKAKDEIA